MKTAFMSMLLSACLVTSCVAVEPTFWLKNKKARMPVVVRGQIESGIMIIFLHGGPGGTALKKIGTRAFNMLEQDVSVVYWDQRGADKSRGGVQRVFLNIDQFVEDLDLLVDHIQLLYPGTHLFLMGHCWGGALATAYLADDQRQQKISAWMMVGGAYNNPKGDSLSSVWVSAHARQMINKGIDARYWMKALKWYQRNPSFSSAALKHYNFVRKANGYQVVKGDSLGQFPCYTMKDVLRKPAQFAAYYLNYFRSLNRFIISDIDLSSQLKEITIPVVIFWGEKDGLIPVRLGLDAFDLAGAPQDHKHLVLYEHVAHTIYYENPTRFALDVRAFLKQYSRPQKREEYKNTVSL